MLFTCTINQSTQLETDIAEISSSLLHTEILNNKKLIYWFIFVLFTYTKFPRMNTLCEEDMQAVLWSCFLGLTS